MPEALAFTRRVCLKSLPTDAGGRKFLSGYKGGRVTSGGMRNRKSQHAKTHTMACVSHQPSTYVEKLRDVRQCLLDAHILFKRCNWYCYYYANETWISADYALKSCFLPCPFSDVDP